MKTMNRIDGMVDPMDQAFNVPKLHSESQEKVDRYLSKLSYAVDAAFSSHFCEYDPQCLTDTRVDFLR